MAIYKCRLCGKEFYHAGTDCEGTASKAAMYTVLESSGITPQFESPNAPIQFDLHNCKDGSYGMADFSVDTDIVARTATNCYKAAASLALKLPDVDPESLRQRTHLKYNASDRTLTCLNCTGETKLGDYDNPEDFKYCPFCGFKVVKIAGCGNG